MREWFREEGGGLEGFYFLGSETLSLPFVKRASFLLFLLMPALLGWVLFVLRRWGGKEMLREL